MSSLEFEKYLADARQRGISDEVIRQELAGAGWSSVDIEATLKPKPVTKSYALIKNLVLGILLSGLGLVLYFLTEGKEMLGLWAYPPLLPGIIISQAIVILGVKYHLFFRGIFELMKLVFPSLNLQYGDDEAFVDIAVLNFLFFLFLGLVIQVYKSLLKGKYVIDWRLNRNSTS